MAAAGTILNTIARGAIGIGAGISLFQASIYNVDGGVRAVMFDRLRGVQVDGMCCPLQCLAQGPPTCLRALSAVESLRRGHALPHPLATDAAPL